VLLLEVPQGFRWIYDRLGNTMADRKTQGQEMTSEETMKEAKEIFHGRTRQWESQVEQEPKRRFKQGVSPDAENHLCRQ
jgi:hypothetical protein